MGTAEPESMYLETAAFKSTQPPPESPVFLDVQILYVECIFFDKFSARFNVFTHKSGEDGVGLRDVFELNPEQRTAFWIHQMLKLVQQWGYTGINIDFESIDYTDRKAFSSFVHDVAQKMRRAGYLTVVSVPAELKANPEDSWTGAFDFASLGEAADILQVMTYDQHGPWGLPGPVAGLNWVEPCVVYAASVVAPDKLSLGIPAYVYDWNTTAKTGVQVFWKDIPTP